MKILAAIFLLSLSSAFAVPAKESDAFVTVGFDQLAGFSFTVPPLQPPGTPETSFPEVMKQVPESVKQLDGRKVIVAGFMLPVKMEHGLTTEFLLLNSPMMCCFGVTPPTNGWIVVKIPKGVKAQQDVPLEFRGQLHVRALWESGYLTSIYQLDADGLVKSGS